MSRARLAGLCLATALLFAAAPPGPVAPGGRLFVANLRSSDVTVVDVATGALLARIGLPANPHELAISPDGRHVYTALYHSNKLAVIDTADYTVRLIDVPGLPHGVAALGQWVVVVGDASGGLTTIEPASGAIDAFAVTGDTPHAVAVDGGDAFVVNTRGGSLARVAGGTDVVTHPIGAGSMPESVAAGGGLVLTANSGDNTVSIIDRADLVEVARVTVEGRPVRVAISPAGRSALVASTARRAVAVIDLAERAVVAWIEVGAAPDGIAFSGDGRWAFVGCGATNDIAVVDVVARVVVGRLPAGDGPSGLLLLP